MKVVHINKGDAGGGASVAALRIHRALLRAGIDSHILVQQQKRSEANEHVAGQGRLYRLNNFANFVHERLSILPQERDKALRYNFSIANTGIDVTELPVVLDADVINIHWINQGFLSLDSLQNLFSLGKPIIWTLHDMWPFTGGCHYAGSCLEFNEKCGFCTFLRNSGRDDYSAQVFQRKKDIYNSTNLTAITCSRWLNTLARSSSLLRNSSVDTIPNPIDTSFYRPLDKAECRQQLGLPLNKKLILFGAANVNDVRKGFRYLQEALLIVSDNFPQMAANIELVIFGKMKHSLGKLGYKCHTLQYVSSPEKMVKIYNACDAYILPSLQDNLPNTVVESLCCGTPVVGFRIGGIPEMIQHQVNGFLAEPKNSLSLANGIYNMLFFGSDKQREATRLSAIDKYDEARVAEQYIDVYKKALRKSQHKSPN